VRRDGRSMIYAARYDTMEALLGYLTENCRKDAPTPSAPAARKSTRSNRANVSAT
jgi:ArsR family transcriptional regulator